MIFPLVKNIYDKLFGDRGYISQSLFMKREFNSLQNLKRI
ncbi:hypothetical protein LEP1GSC035_1090 [Leptospira noguchii str. 2007001578]|uniref:Transposase DDE domain protein n=1 Tax=Leptospira noguchii str. 2007001578 TaxID=1049974 RepID=A0ABP2T563_9LEPT|nr:hypothetical protein LEP1GSC035_1090 [Leptospira noguchii str. 2007001578]